MSEGRSLLTGDSVPPGGHNLQYHPLIIFELRTEILCMSLVKKIYLLKCKKKQIWAFSNHLSRKL